MFEIDVGKKAPYYQQMRRRRGAFLCFDVDCDVGFLTSDEVQQLLDSVHGLKCPAWMVDLTALSNHVII